MSQATRRGVAHELLYMWRAAVCCVAGLCGRFSSVSVSEKGAPGHWPARRRSLWSWVAMVTNGPPIPKMWRGKPPKRNGRPSIARLTLEPITPLYAYIACYARKTDARDTSSIRVIVSYNRRLYNEKCVVCKMLRERRISKEILLIFTFIPSLFSML